MKISIVDYGAGNLASVERAFQRLGATTERAARPEAIARAGAIVLPGVGHFSAFVGGLRERNLAEALGTAFAGGVPLLGICLGLQAFFESSAEAPGAAGLRFLPGEARALPTSVKSPHIGWNQVTRVAPSRLLRDVSESAYFYFAHSFALPAGEAHSVALCDHGFPFAAVVEWKNLMAVQFHPEKSAGPGEQVLRNFLEAAR
ncbi:MAG: imidazole glycerol phosphate synthase subunit HisH [Candidatus Acidiferrales bacterium]